MPGPDYTQYQEELQPLRAQYNANLQKIWGIRFAPPFFVIVFILTTIAILFFLYPKKELLTELKAVSKSDYVAQEYMRVLVRSDSQDKFVAFLLAQQNLKSGKIDRAIKLLQPLIKEKPDTYHEWYTLYLYYQALAKQTFYREITPQQHANNLLQLKKYTPILEKGPFSLTQMVYLATAAASLKQQQSADVLYKRILAQASKLLLAEQLYLAKHALASGDYQTSAALYFAAQAKAESLALQRKYFIAGLKALQSGNLLNQAVAAAKQHVGNLINDKQTLLFLTELARAANRPDLAADYIEKVVF